ncbi:MAG: GTP cyclohydrolase I FolE2 [Betaproteobacteria bacterium]|nr:GTP cyclohydrolase I FolE2 [Betaproteobacteria bacterium]
MNTRESGAPLNGPMPDVQGSLDERRLAIQRVGVKGVRYPLRWRTADGGVQPSVGEFALYVALPEDQKGTHMSRFIGLLEEISQADAPALDVATVVALHRRMLGLLEAERGCIEMSFALFVRKTAPVSGVQSLLDYQVRVVVDGDASSPAATLTVVAPVKSLCPCSKTISDYGAHNQRSHITLSVRTREPMAPEALIRIAEEEASSEIYGLLKRVDEKFITERAYDNPKFVEDLVRDVAGRLRDHPAVIGFVAEAENFESIHNHSAYARIESAPG